MQEEGVCTLLRSKIQDFEFTFYCLRNLIGSFTKFDKQNIKYK